MTRSTEIERTAYILRLGVIAAFLLLILWIAGAVLLKVFAGVLLAVMLVGLSRQICRRTPLSHRWALSIVTAGFFGLTALILLFLTPRLTVKINQLLENAGRGIEQLSRQLSVLLPNMSLPSDALPSLPQLGSGFFQFGATVTDVLVTVVVIAFIGFYAAAHPSWYVNGFLRLLPDPHRGRVREILHESGRSLQLWLFGRAVAMVAVAILTVLALKLQSIPLAMSLGLIAGLLTFIPYIGALISAVPAILVGFAQSPVDALYVVAVFTGIHIVEGYILIPQIQQRTVHMPPVLLLCAQVLFGTFYGIPGVMLAAPLTVVVMVATRAAYLRDGGHAVRREFALTGPAADGPAAEETEKTGVG